jgi:transcriptional regulator with XRE-family HTH domain/predicted negative regulator of RcsB-dependent stress response
VSLGNRIRNARVSKGLTQAQLASPRYAASYISALEHDRRRPSPDALTHLASKLGVEAEDLTSGRDRKRVPELELSLFEARRALSKGEIKEAEAIYSSITRKARRASIHEIVIRARIGLALCEERKGDFQAALAIYEALESSLEDSDLILEPDLIIGRARCLQLTGDPRYAIFVLESYADRLHVGTVETPSALSRIHSALVPLYLELGLYSHAKRSAELAMRMAVDMQNTEEKATMYLNVARVFLRQNRYSEATQLLRQAESLYDRLDLRTESGLAHLALGYIFARTSKVDSARTSLAQAIDLLQQNPNPTYWLLGVVESARIDRIQGNAEAARAALQSAYARRKDLSEQSLTMLQDRKSVV